MVKNFQRLEKRQNLCEMCQMPCDAHGFKAKIRACDSFVPFPKGKESHLSKKPPITTPNVLGDSNGGSLLSEEQIKLRKKRAKESFAEKYPIIRGIRCKS